MRDRCLGLLRCISRVRFAYPGCGLLTLVAGQAADEKPNRLGGWALIKATGAKPQLCAKA